MIRSDLLSIICCPETHQTLKFADATVLERVNGEIAAGKLKNRAGAVVTERMDGGLVREDGKYLYPIRRDIPELLVEEGIPLDATA